MSPLLAPSDSEQYKGCLNAHYQEVTSRELVGNLCTTSLMMDLKTLPIPS